MLLGKVFKSDCYFVLISKIDIDRGIQDYPMILTLSTNSTIMPLKFSLIDISLQPHKVISIPAYPSVIAFLSQ